MAPTMEELGITVEHHKSGNCTVHGPARKLRLNIEGAMMTTHYGIQYNEEFQMGDLITSVWGCISPGLVILLFGNHTLINVDPKRDDWFLDTIYE